MAAALREVDGANQGHGLVIYRASRLEGLLEALVPLLEVTQPANLLEPQVIIAAHPGMRRWLNDALARRAGPQGIAANLDILLMSVWIDRLAEQCLGQHAIALSRYRHRHLRWLIHQLLAQGPSRLQALGITDPRIALYLQDEVGRPADVARRRFQLADRLADLLAKYMIYRPDWLLAWQHGVQQLAPGFAAAPPEACALHAPLWRALVNGHEAHRGAVVTMLQDKLLHPEDVPPVARKPVHVFGISHMAPAELALLQAQAQHALVALYVPDPCREYWGGLRSDLAALRQARRDEDERIAAAGDEDYWVEQDHPLLARWGRLGQHFIMSLVDGAGDVLCDVRHSCDEQASMPGNRLERVQQSIRELDVSLLTEQVIDPRQCRDASLRVHACTTRLRELEVLRDQILDAMAQAAASGRPLDPGEIVVMAPSIQTYAPLLPTVFGISSDAAERLEGAVPQASQEDQDDPPAWSHTPYAIVDAALESSHPLLGAFRRFLALPGSRLTAAQLADLLAEPHVALRLGLDEEATDELVGWLRDSGAAWALDGAFRARFGVPPIREHTFSWAMDRMIAGYIMADAATAEHQAPVRLADGIELLPMNAIQFPAAAHLGALQQLLEHIDALCTLASREQRASQWVKDLQRLFEAVFRAGPERRARQAWQRVLGFIRDLALEPQAVGADPLLHFAVVRDILAQRLAAVSETRSQALGRITFCSMVPQRAIPFRFVAVLGLNDGEFPRQESSGGLDLMAQQRRLGDRDLRMNDRYFFLETLMSAREHLHLSYIGEDEHTGKPRNPAQPLAELLAILEQHARDERSAEEKKGHGPPWLVRHAPQPFDTRYFDSHDDRLFSYSKRHARMTGQGEEPAVAPFLGQFTGPIGQQRQETSRHPSLEPVGLRELHGYYKDPARHILEHTLHLSLAALDDGRLQEDEPMQPAFQAIDTMARRLFFGEALQVAWDAARQGIAPQEAWQPEQPPDWLRLGGRLPPGKPGQMAWEKECHKVKQMLGGIDRLPGFGQGSLELQSQPIELQLGQVRLMGLVANIHGHDTAAGRMWLVLRAFDRDKLADLHFKDRVPMFLDWAVLRLRYGLIGKIPAVRLFAMLQGSMDCPLGIAAWDERFMAADLKTKQQMLADLESRVRQLIAWWHEAAAYPVRYFPKTSWRALQEGQEKAVSAWQGNGYNAVGERDYAPGYARMLAGALDLTDEEAFAGLRGFAAGLDRCISLMDAP